MPVIVVLLGPLSWPGLRERPGHPRPGGAGRVSGPVAEGGKTNTTSSRSRPPPRFIGASWSPVLFVWCFVRYAVVLTCLPIHLRLLPPLFLSLRSGLVSWGLTPPPHDFLARARGPSLVVFCLCRAPAPSLAAAGRVCLLHQGGPLPVSRAVFLGFCVRVTLHRCEQWAGRMNGRQQQQW